MKVIEISAYARDVVHTVKGTREAKRLRKRLRETQKKVLFYTEQEWKELDLDSNKLNNK